MFNYCIIGGRVRTNPEISLNKEGEGRVFFELDIWVTEAIKGGYLTVFCLGELAAVVHKLLHANDWVVATGKLWRIYDRVRRSNDLQLWVTEMARIQVLPPEAGRLLEE
jgi:hypothetical protein